VSESTVRSQIRSIFQKLGVNSQLRAVSLARQVGWTADLHQ
jgi:DNA-binding CsgD family transcriptional regulator